MKHFNNLHKNTDPQNRTVPQGNYKLKQSYHKLGYLEIYKKLRHYGIVIGTDLYINEKIEISATHIYCKFSMRKVGLFNK